jgi:hypothetical protein
MYLRNFIVADHGDWVNLLPEAEFCYNTAHATSIAMSPFKAGHEFDALKPMDLVLARNEDVTSNYFSEKAAKLAHRWEFIQVRAKENLEKAQRKYNKAADKKRREVVLKEGDKAWLKTENLTISNTLAHKWTPKWAGPYEVLKVLHKDVYLIDAPKKERFHRVFHISKLKKFIKDDKNFHPDQVFRPKADNEVWNKMIGQLSGIVDKKTQKNEGVAYQCIMHGYPPTEYQWIGESYLRHVPHLIQAFKEKTQREKTTQTLKRKARRR